MPGKAERTQEAKPSAIWPGQPQQDLVMALPACREDTWFLLITITRLSAVPAYWKSSDTAAGAKTVPNPTPGKKKPRIKKKFI